MVDGAERGAAPGASETDRSAEGARWTPPPPAGPPHRSAPWAAAPVGGALGAGRRPAHLVELDAALAAGDVPLGRQLDAGAVPVTPSSAGVWLLFGALGFLVGQILAGIAVAVSAAVAGQGSHLSAISHMSEPPTWYVISTLLGLWAGFLGGPWAASAVRGSRSLVRDFGLRFRWADLLGIPIGVGGQFLVALMYIPIAQHVHDFNQRFNAPGQKLTGGSHGVGFVLIAVATVLCAPFFEELFFRGLLLRALARLFGHVGGWVGPALAIVVTGLLFGLAHAESLQLLGLAAFGIILSFVSYRTGRLGMNMVSHAAFNLVAVIAALGTGSGVLF